MSDNPLLAAFNVQAKSAPKPTGNNLLDAFQEQKQSQQGFDFGEFKPDPAARPVAKQIGAAAMKRSLDPNTGDLGRQTVSSPGEDSWADTGRKFASRIVPLLKQSLAGIAQGVVETGAPNMPGMTPQENADAAAEYQSAVAALAKEGKVPGQKMFAAATKDLEANGYNPGDSSIKKYAAMIAESGVQMLPTIAATLATRSPSIGAAVMGGQVGGQQYGESRLSNRDPGQAAMDATFMAVSETLGEKVPLGFMMKSGGKFLANTLRTAGAESVQEVLTQILQTGYDKGVLHPEMTWEEAKQQVIDAGIVGFGMGAGMHVAAAPFVRKEDPNANRRNDLGINADVAAAMDPNGYNPGDIRQYAAPLTGAAPNGIGLNAAGVAAPPPPEPEDPASPADAAIASLSPPTSETVTSPAAPFRGKVAQRDSDGRLLTDDGIAPVSFKTQKEAAKYQIANGFVGTYDIATNGNGFTLVINPVVAKNERDTLIAEGRARRAAEAAAAKGVIEGAATDAAQLSQADLDSPIPNDVIAQGKAELARATAAPAANGILSSAGLPEVGGRVSINWNGTTIGGEVLDAFDTDAGTSGRAQGVRIRRDDGTMLEEHFDTLRDLGVSIAPELTPSSPAAVSTTPATAPGGGSVSAAPISIPAPAPAAERERPTPGGIPGFMAKVGRAESPNDTAKNPRSSAQGRYQFTDGTFERTYRSVFGDTGETREQILAKKTDGKLQDRLMQKLTQDNTNALRKAGFQPTDGNRYLAHFAGSGGAVALLRVSGDTPVERVLGAKVIEANPFLRGKTASEVVAWAARKMGGPAGRGVDMAAADAIDVNDDATPVQFKDMDWGDEGTSPQGDGTSSAPIVATTDDDVTAAAARVAEPTEAQKEAGNYAKGHLNLHGLDIAIETPRGAERSGTDGAGKRWSVAMPDHYGYVKRTTGADGDQVDVYVGPKPESQKVYVIDQVDAATGAFDEHKAMLGYETRTAALKAYHAAFSDGRGGDRVGAVTDTDVTSFKGWLDGGSTNQPMGTLRARPAARSAKPVDAVTFLARNGGIRDDEGHALKRRAQSQGAGSRDLSQFAPGGGHVFRKNGMTIDEAGELLAEAGYFDERPTTTQVLDMLDRAAFDNQYRPADQADVDTARRERDDENEREGARVAAEEALDEIGIDDATSSDIDGIVAFMSDGRSAVSAVEDYYRQQAEARSEDYYERTQDPEYDVPFGDEGQRSSDFGNVEGFERSAPDASAAEGRGPDRRSAPEDQPAQVDAFGERDGDQRRALERAGEGRSRSDRAQKAPGSDGGLFDDNAGRQVDLLDAPARAPAPPAPPAPTFTDTPSGKGVAVGNLTDEQKAIIARDVPKAKGVANKDGAVVYSKKQEDAIRAALAAPAAASDTSASSAVAQSVEPSASRGVAGSSPARAATDGWPVDAPVRDLMRDDNRYAVRGGAVLTTQSGRKTSPAPRFNDSTQGNRKKSLRAQASWLVDEALAEAEATRSNALPFLRRMVRDAENDNLSQSDFYTINDVLFGDMYGPAGRASYSTDRTPPKRKGGDDLTERRQSDPFGARNEGAEAFAEGSGRVPPARLNADEKRMWLQGWDGANLDAPVEDATDTSEREEDAAFLRVWQSPAFKAAIKSIGTMPHRESPVAYETVRGWQDGKARDLEALMQFESSDSHVSTLSAARKGGGTGWNPEVAYIEGFYAAVMPEAREVRAIKTGNKMGARDAIDAIAEVLDPQGSPAPSPNRLVSDDRAAELRARLKGKLNQINSGIDPEVLAIGAELAVYHIEKGARRFVAFARTIAADLQMELPKLRPYLRSWFNGARDMMEDHGASIDGMDNADDVAAAMRMFDQWADAGVPTAPAQETTDGLQGTVPAGDGGSGTADVEGPAQDGGAGRLRPEAVGGGARAVRGTDEGTGANAVGRGDRSGEAADRGAERARPDAGLPTTRAGVSRAGVAAGNFTIAPGALDEARGPKAKALDNLAAIETLKTLQREGRPATAEEQQQLARYVGWGGLKNVFPDGDGVYGKGFEDVGRKLRGLLSNDEYDTARRSIQYAHYTSETIVREMWRGAQALGFTGGSVFEPGMGTGNFAGMMPPALAANVRYSGIEMDGVTAGIAKALYPQSGVAQADYTRYDAPKDAFDLVIGNPPFSETVVKADPAYKTKGFVLHDYFFAKSLDSVKPGGLLMFVTSAGTMNKLDTKAREYLAARADLVGAVRLPGDAFEQNAGTKVTTDIIVLRKRTAGEQAGDQTWIETTTATLPTKDGTPKEGNVSRYFADNPDQVLGEQGFFDPLYPERYAVRRDRSTNTPFGEQLAAAIDRLGSRAAQAVDTTPPPRAPADIEFDTGEKKNGSFYLNDKGVLFQQTGSVGVPVSAKQKGAKGGLSATDQEKVKQLVPVRDALRDIYRADLNDRTAEADAARAKLNSLYDAFVAKHGPINKGVFTRRRPSRVTIESARRKAREEARARGFEWEDGTFDAESMFDGGATLAQVAAAREEARADAQRAGKAWDEGTFDPEDVPDTVLEKRPNIDAFMDDPESYRLRSIEHYNDSTGEASKGPVFYQNVVSKQGEAVIKTPVDALYHMLNLTGRVDLDHIGRLVGLSPSDVVDALAGQIYRTPQGEWQQAATYLSGNVRTKLAEAEAAAANDPSLRGNVEALRAVVPADLGKADVRATLGMNWINPTYIQEFGKALGLERFEVKYQPITAAWTVNGDRSSAAATSTWGTERRSASELIDDALNGKSPKIYDTFKNADGNTQSVLNNEATQAATDKLVAIKDRFKEWVWQDDARAETLLRIYNDTFNSLVAPTYDGSYMTTPGVSALWSWRPHQTGVMARIVQEGNTYMAHAVGAGKTSAMIGAGMEMKRLGLVNKPMYVVPNHMLAQFTKEFYEQYPTARIMVADDDRNFITDKRKQFISDMALADIDAVIIKHSAFGLIPLSSEFQEGMLTEQLEELRATLNEVDKGERQTRRKIEQMVEQTEQRIRSITSGKKDQTFTFEETGVDFLFVDEAHLFRKLDFVTSRGDVKGIDPTGSMRSMDLFMKTRMLEGRRPGRSHVLASGTPITNTMAELYSISRYLQPDTLRERGIDRFDAWASAFGDTVTDLEPTAGGTYKPVTRFSQFVNVPELSAMVRQVMDVVTPEQLEQYVTRPAVRNHMVVVPESPGQAAYRAQLQARMEAIEKRKGPPKKGDDIMLSVINDGRNAAIDMRLVDPAEDEERTKLMEAIENVSRIWKETKRHPFYDVTPEGYSAEPAFYAPAAQMVFASRGVGAGRAFNVHRFMVEELVKRGVSRDEVVIFNALKNDVAKQRVFNDMKVGKVRILLGSVDKMGTGVNAQRLLAANHNMDPEWLPSSDEQRNGRIIRQGNLNKSVDIYNYSTKGTYDSAMWGMMGRKAKFIEGFFRGDPTLRDMEDLGEASKYEQAKALTTRDPRILVLTEAKQELEKELRRRSAFESDIVNAQREQRQSIRYADRLEASLENERLDAAQRVDISGDNFTAMLNPGDAEPTTYTERAAFQEALNAILDETPTREDIVEIGQLGGFTLARQDYKQVKFGDEGKKVTFYSQPVLLLNGDRLGEDAERRYKELAKTGTAVSAQRFLDKLDRIVSETEADIARYRQRAEEFATRAAETGDYPGTARIAELSEQVKGIEAELAAETKAAEAAKTKEGPQAPVAEDDSPKYSIIGETAATKRTFDRYSVAGLRDRLIALGINDRVTLQVVDRIQNNEAFGGQYWNRVLTVATDARNADGSVADPSYTLDHEAIHAMRELGLFRAAEWTALEKRASGDRALMADVRRRYADQNLSEEGMIEEAVSDLFARWRQGREEAGFIRSAFNRVLDLLNALHKLFGGGPTGGSTMRAIDTGEIGSRQEMVDSLLNPKPFYSRVQAPGSRHEFADASVEKRWATATEGLGAGDGLLLRVKTNLANVRDGFTRHWEALPNIPRYAALQQKLRALESAPQAARERAVLMLSDMVKGFTRDDLDLLARKVVLDDLIWEADQDHALPFGLTPETLRAEKQRVDAIVDAQPGRKVWAAAMKRKLVNRQVANDLVAAGVLEAERVKNPSYFRHQVLDYARTEARLARGTGARLRSPKWAKRMGSSLDINANLLEAEFDWLSKALTDIPTAQTIDWIKKSDLNILDRLKKQAKDSNEQGITDLIAKEKDRDGAVTAKEREFKGRFGYGFSVIRDELDAGTIRNIPQALKRAADAIQSGQKDGDAPFAFLSWLLDTDQPGARGAAIILKAVGERRAFRMKALGDKYVDPDDAESLVKRFAPEGYATWQPEEGKLLFTVKTLPEHAIDAMIQHIDTMPADGVDPTLMRAQLEKARKVMVVGGDKYKMILPQEVAETLNELRRPDIEGLIGQIFSVPLAKWKQWQLINPRRIIKYNLNNLSGDLDAVLAGNPRLLRRTPEAARELASVMRGKAQPSARYQEAVDRGVFDSGLSIQEIPDINQLSAFSNLTVAQSNRPDKLAGAAIGKVWRGLKGFTQWRENVFRYAAYLDYADRIEAGEDMASIGYGASVPKMVDAVDDLQDKAALLARDLMGDYGAISKNGAWLRSHLVPFWSWTELNTKRYWRLTLNAGSQGIGRGVATGGALAITAGVRTSVWLGLRMAVIYGLINFWNWMMFDDEEKELSEDQQRQLHIILGRNDAGEVVTLRTQGAASDVLGIIGFADAAAAIKAHELGRGTIGGIIGAVAKAPVNRVATSITPLFSIPVESFTGKKLWPDAFNPRPIRDKWRNLAQSFSLDNEYDLANDLPSRGYVRSWMDSVVYRRQPGEIAYDEAKGIAYDWLERVKGQEGGESKSKNTEAYRRYRTALRYNDQSAADEALNELGSHGVTEKDLAGMVKRADPLGPIAKKDRAAFLESLTDEELEKFARADQWYRATFQ